MTRSAASIERTFARLEAVAIAGERCPPSSGPGGGQINRSDMTALAQAGRISVEISTHNWRQVTILTGPNAGKSTAANPHPKATVYMTVDATGTRRNGKLIDNGARSRQQPSAPRLLTSAEIFR